MINLFKKGGLAAAALVALLATVSCQKEESDVLVTSVTLSKTELSLVKGTSESITATVAPEDATVKDLVWASSDAAVATVEAGNITAVGVGTATITATATDASGANASCVVTVTPDIILVSAIELSDAYLSLTKTDVYTLTAIVTPEDATDISVIWESSDESVATVDVDGNVTALLSGVAIITATANDESGVSASCEVTVNDPVIDLEINSFIPTDDGGWCAGYIDILDFLCEKFGLTPEELEAANANGEIYPQACSSEESHDTWYDVNANDVGWEGEGFCFYVGPYFGRAEEVGGNNIYNILFGKYPGNLEPGQKTVVDYPISYGENKVWIRINAYSCPEAEIVSYDITANSQQDWRNACVPGVQAELCSQFGLTPEQLEAANANGEIYMSACSEDESHDYWYNRYGHIVGWGGYDFCFYVGPYYGIGYVDGANGDNVYALAYGTYPGALPAGISFKVDYPVTYGDKVAKLRINVTTE